MKTTPPVKLCLVHAISASKTRRVPARHSRDAKVYGHTTTAMHEMSTTPPVTNAFCAPSLGTLVLFSDIQDMLLSLLSYCSRSCLQAGNGPRAPAAATSAAQLLDNVIANLEASLGLQPGEAVSVAGVTEGTASVAAETGGVAKGAYSAAKGTAEKTGTSKGYDSNVRKKTNAKGKGKKGNPLSGNVCASWRDLISPCACSLKHWCS